MAKMSIADELGLSMEDRAKCKDLARKNWAAFISVRTGVDLAAAYDSIRLEPVPAHFNEHAELTFCWHRDMQAAEVAKSMYYDPPPDPAARIH